jgi:hypothetical protein
MTFATKETVAFCEGIAASSEVKSAEGQVPIVIKEEARTDRIGRREPDSSTVSAPWQYKTELTINSIPKGL